MATFPNAFKKVFVGAGTLAATGTKTKALTAGQLALIDATTHAAIDPAAVSPNFPKQAYLAMGSYRTSDKIGQFHGGYAESIKSKGINPRYVTRFWKQTPTTPQSQIVRVGYDAATDATNPTFLCGKTYNLRVDLKGSPVLRFLGRNAYKTLSAFTGCCADDANPTIVDPATVTVAWANEINGDPIFSKFVTASVQVKVGVAAETTANLATYTANATPSDVKTALILTINYADTVFNNDSFDQFDHVEREPVVVTAAVLVDESGDPCSGFKQLTFTETQAIRLPQGLGETLIRDLILFKQYLQDPFQRDNRKRQIESDPIFGTVDRTKYYKSYYILHSVPRFSNPSSTFDNDQYLIQLSFESTVNTTAIETFLSEFIESGNTGVTLEDLS